MDAAQLRQYQYNSKDSLLTCPWHCHSHCRKVKCINASKLVYWVALLFVGRLYISFNPCKFLHDTELSSHSALLIYPENAEEQKQLQTHITCGATQSCRDELTQDQHLTADHSIDGYALWVFYIGKEFPGLQVYNNNFLHALEVVHSFRMQDSVPAFVLHPP